MQFRNYKGELVNAPADKPVVLASQGGSMVVWSRDGPTGRHMVRYGLQAKFYTDDLLAAHEFGECVRHYLECQGLLD